MIITSGDLHVDITQAEDGRWFGTFKPNKKSSAVESVHSNDIELIIQWANNILHQWNVSLNSAK